MGRNTTPTETPAYTRRNRHSNQGLREGEKKVDEHNIRLYVAIQRDRGAEHERENTTSSSTQRPDAPTRPPPTDPEAKRVRKGDTDKRIMKEKWR